MKLQYIIINRLFTISLIGIMAVMLMASCASQKTEYNIPEPKTALVSQDTPYEEKLQFPFDDKGLDINVSLAFDEAENMLTLTVKGSRQLMVFRQDTFYGMIFKHPFLKQREMIPAKLPYPVLVQPNMKITLSNNVWKSFKKSRVQHLFNSWLVGVSPELQPVTPSIDTEESPEATLIVESVTQRFRVDPKATKASFTLRNFLVIDKDGIPVSVIQQKRSPSSSLKYEIVYEKDLNLTFNVRIQRNPCFAQDSLIESAKGRIAEVRKAYANLHEACPEGTVSSTQEQGVFNQHRKFLLSQFPCITDSSACSLLQEAYTRYNSYVDSIKNAPCVYVKPQPEPGKDEYGMPSIGIRASHILDMAHRLDNIVSQIMVTRDISQVHDLIDIGNNLIKTLTKAVQEKGLINTEQKDAYQEFLKAKTYFRSAILKK